MGSSCLESWRYCEPGKKNGIFICWALQVLLVSGQASGFWSELFKEHKVESPALLMEVKARLISSAHTPWIYHINPFCPSRWLQPWNWMTIAPWEKSYDKTRQCIIKQRHHFANKGPYSQSYGFLSSHVQMWELNHKESWALKNRCFWTVLLEKTLESPSDSKKIKLVNPTGSQLWIFIGRTDTEAEVLVLWPHDEKSQLIRKDPEAGKGWVQEEKGTRED